MRGIDHIVLLTPDLAAAAAFWSAVGISPDPTDDGGIVLDCGGGTLLFFYEGPVGIDHLAFAANAADLPALAARLSDAGIANNGVEMRSDGCRYVSFDGPDGVTYEWYAR